MYSNQIVVLSSIKKITNQVSLVIENPNTEIPDFNANSFVNGLLSNTLSYLIARYGDKVAENIDLSSLSFFKKK